MKRLSNSLFRKNILLLSTSAVATSANVNQCQTRSFRSNTQEGGEFMFIGDQDADLIKRYRNVPTVSGIEKPALKEGEWRCRFPLNERMVNVITKLCNENGWTEDQLDHELSQLNILRSGGIGGGQRGDFNAGQAWNTVEDFQRLPWYKRYSAPTRKGMISYELVAMLEKELIPPSRRSDPYAHLRKRYLEDSMTTIGRDENFAKESLRKDKISKMNKGNPDYGKISRKQYMEFEERYKKRVPCDPNDTREHGEIYIAWMQERDENLSSDAMYERGGRTPGVGGRRLF